MVNIKPPALKGPVTKSAPKERHIPGYNFCGPGTAYKERIAGNYEEMMKKAGGDLKGRFGSSGGASRSFL